MRFTIRLKIECDNFLNFVESKQKKMQQMRGNRKNDEVTIRIVWEKPRYDIESISDIKDVSAVNISPRTDSNPLNFMDA